MNYKISIYKINIFGIIMILIKLKMHTRNLILMLIDLANKFYKLAQSFLIKQMKIFMILNKKNKPQYSIYLII